MESIELDDLNYISKKLVKSAQDVWSELDKKCKVLLTTIIRDIMGILKEYKYFDRKFITEETINLIKYNMISSSSCVVEEMGVIDNSSYIRKQLNTLKEYEIVYRTKKIRVKIYCNEDTCEENIKKIIVRLYNMFILYENKCDKTFNLLDFEYIFYLYNNPRRVSRHKSGREYIEEINRSKKKCFNTASGVTEHETQILRTSRIEDCLGLLTHEMLHGTSLIFITNSKLIHGINVNFTEAYVNMFAAIVNVYLTCIETNNIKAIECYLLVELIHSINHAIKYSILQGYSIKDILNDDTIVLHQNVYMYEYIVVKMFLFLNFKDNITSNKEFGDMFLSLDRPWTPDMTEYTSYIVDKFSKYTYLDCIGQIDRIHRSNLNKHTDNESMLMSYHAIDTMIISRDKEIKELYGGGDFFYKYIKYRTKYIHMKNNQS